MVLPNARYRAQRLATAASIEFIGSNIINGTSVSIPAHQSGDLLVVVASGLGATPQLASGWTNINGSDIIRVAYRISDGTLANTGAFGSAIAVAVVIYRGAHATTPIGNTAIGSQGANSATIPALSGIDTGAWTVRAGVSGNGMQTGNPSTAPSTRRAGNAWVAYWDSDGPGTTVVSTTITGSGYVKGCALEILPA